MKTIGQLVQEYNLDRGTLLKAAKVPLLLGEVAKQSGHIWLIDDESEQFKHWLQRHNERGLDLCNCENCKKDRRSRNPASEKKQTQKPMPTKTTLRPEKPVSEMIAEISLGDTVISASFTEYHGGFVDVVKSLCYGWKQGVWKRKINVFSGPTEDRAVELGHALLANGFIVRIFDDALKSRIISGDFEPEQTRWITKRASDDYTGWFTIRWGKKEDYYTAARKITGSRYHKSSVIVPPEQFEQVLDFAERYDFRLSEGSQSLAQQAKETKESMLVVKIDPDKQRKVSPPSTMPTAMDIPDVVEIDEDLRDE